MTATIRYPANDIPTEGVAIDVELDAAWLARTLADAGVSAHHGADEGGRVWGRLSRSRHDIVVRGHVAARVEVACVRCLDPTVIAVQAPLTLLLKPAPKPHRPSGRGQSDQEMELTAADAEVDVYEGDTVVLDNFVREAILLEIPSFPLCREGCPGLSEARPIPLADAENDRVDPRLAPLGAFRNAHSTGREEESAGGGAPTSVESLVAAAAARSSALSGRRVLLRRNRGPGGLVPSGHRQGGSPRRKGKR